MSMEDTVQKKCLVATGFLTNQSRQSYQHISGINCDCLRAERTHEILTSRPVTEGNRRQLRQALQEDIATLRQQYSEAKYLAIATPGLELLTRDQANATGIKIISQVDLVVAHCLKNQLNSVGLLGTEWDVTEDSPLTLALKCNGIQVYTPDKEHRSSVTTCVVNAPSEQCIQHKRGIVRIDKFCSDVIAQMGYTSCGTMQAVLICNPELRSITPFLCAKLNPEYRLHFVKVEVIDMAELYWHEIKRVSQS